jgi:hypothetical protein
MKEPILSVLTITQIAALTVMVIIGASGGEVLD